MGETKALAEVKVLAEAMLKTSEVISNLCAQQKAMADLLKTYADRILELGNRQDTLWATLQGLTKTVGEFDKRIAGVEEKIYDPNDPDHERP